MNTALIIGASRGLGLALAEEYLKRDWRVIATVRGETPAKLNNLWEAHSKALEIEQLDINKPDQLSALRTKLAGRKIDLLFVNAGVNIDPQITIGKVTTEDFQHIMATNALNPMRSIESLEHLVPATGVIAVMSSGLGSVANNETGGYEIYRASKASLNTFMRSFAARHAGDKRAMLIIAPGWVRTDMGGPGAPLEINDSIPRVVDVITSNTGKPGVRYLDYQGKTVPW
jgi:NAD(P)-dependent dehydrogenase (short-subunit alcohol dehydrogenase family)